ncbi:AEC family transporter [Paracoccus sp. DMF-8]|uniref:AEC family transporter n=1 Tax=Paracoccus sp. DMF-8 TaxID=3019445 RepID=UPI0023E3F55E|nr:AEC family transporter [Paracoccus sp. DMF-8]MDF3607831.1 AEC family transporter [Paracoccus sp. DMF-8]
MSATVAIIPIALLVAIGYLARRSGLVPASAWSGIELCCYRLFFPAIMLVSVYRADLDWSRIGPFSMALIAAVWIAGLAAFVLKPVLSLPNQQFTTLFATSTRWNAFVSLAMASQMMGAKGTALVSVAMAFLIPAVNLANILVLAIWGSAGGSLGRMLRAVVTNPLILGCTAGLALNLLHLRIPPPVTQGLDMLGASAIPASLLIVGAGIQIDRLWSVYPALWLGVGIKLLALPAIFWMLGRHLGLAADLMVAGLIATSVPTAANGYIVARQMGGDADLYADILTWQTLLAVVSIPFVLSAFS